MDGHGKDPDDARRIYRAGRRIEAALSDSVRMMWLSQNQKPSYRTVNRFRVHPIMDKLLKSLFVNFRTQLIEQKLIDNESIFLLIKSLTLLAVFLCTTFHENHFVLLRPRRSDLRCPIVLRTLR